MAGDLPHAHVALVEGGADLGLRRLVNPRSTNRLARLGAAARAEPWPYRASPNCTTVLINSPSELTRNWAAGLRMKMTEIYVSTDIEADGPIPGPNSML